MIKQTLERIDKLLKDKDYEVPEIFDKLFAFLMHFAKRIEQKNSEFTALDLFADALKLFKNYLVEEPFKLTKVTTAELNKALQSNSLEHFSSVFSLRDRFLNELAPYAPNDAFGKRALSEMIDLKWAKKMKNPLFDALALKQCLQLKKGGKINLSQMTVMFWYGDLKGQNIVHLYCFTQKLLIFLKEYFPALDFMNANSLHYLRQICDPEKKYFVTAFNCDLAFIKLRNPEVLERLWQNSQENGFHELFVSESSLILRITNLDNSIDQIIGVTGQKIILGEGHEKEVKLPPAVVVGSSVQSDIVLKSKYISRKQMSIIEDRKSQKLKETECRFTIVCLSQSNFTIVSYPQRTRALVGTIFFGKNIKYQILFCEKMEIASEFEDEDDDKTLSILPSENKAGSKPKTGLQKMTFLILSGEDKDKEVNLQSTAFPFLPSQNDKHLSSLKQILEEDNGFYLKPQTKILCKTSNEILEGRLSRKIRLRKGMKIYLEEFTLTIE